VIQEVIDSNSVDTRPPSFAKRLFDVAFASIALVGLIPLLLILMLAIVVESPGNPIFLQERVGFKGRRFPMLKLRTMVPGADKRLSDVAHLNEADGPLFKVRRDPRVTRMGRLLRATSLDELPQFLNVLAGQMSLVGPRPPLPNEVAAYTPVQARRLTVMPGLTGLWQVSGRSDLTFDDCIALDLRYVDNWTFWLDLQLIARTVVIMITGRGAY
jgi:lipopolysaccharide/colanic/teichoic acid biosynthesis glycosyltransferase